MERIIQCMCAAIPDGICCQKDAKVVVAIKGTCDILACCEEHAKDYPDYIQVPILKNGTWDLPSPRP